MTNRRRTGKSVEVVLTGGPWVGQTVVQRPERRNEEEAMPLPIRVGAHVGRYNLNTGAWQSLEQHGENV